jgi:hypothetical protein
MVVNITEGQENVSASGERRFFEKAWRLLWFYSLFVAFCDAVFSIRLKGARDYPAATVQVLE